VSKREEGDDEGMKIEILFKDASAPKVIDGAQEEQG